LTNTNVAVDSSLTLEAVPCDQCGRDDATCVAESRDRDHGVQGLFQVVKCNHCGLTYMNPRPTPQTIGNCYPTDYYAYGQPEKMIQRPKDSISSRIKLTIRRSRLLSALVSTIPRLRHMARDSHLAEDIIGWIAPGKVLDVGCGAGGFLDDMRATGWATYGIEPSSGAARIANENGHCVSAQSILDPLPKEFEASRFDLIWMSHSLEHVHAPTQTMETVARLLKPNCGYLVVEVPNVESALTLFFGEIGLAFDTPRHLYLFGPQTLSALLKKTGFEIVSIRHISRPRQFIRCINFLIADHTPKNWQTQAQKLMQDPGLSRSLTPLAEFVDEMKLGGAIRVVARLH